MDKRLAFTQAKELRGEIIKTLYDFYGEDVSLNTIKNMLRYKNYYSENDVKRSIKYLSGKSTGYIHFEPNQDDYWDSLVQLTPIGINLAEGDEKNVGVLINE